MIINAWQLPIKELRLFPWRREFVGTPEVGGIFPHMKDARKLTFSLRVSHSFEISRAVRRRLWIEEIPREWRVQTWQLSNQRWCIWRTTWWYTLGSLCRTWKDVGRRHRLFPLADYRQHFRIYGSWLAKRCPEKSGHDRHREFSSGKDVLSQRWADYISSNLWYHCSWQVTYLILLSPIIRGRNRGKPWVVIIFHVLQVLINDLGFWLYL